MWMLGSRHGEVREGHVQRSPAQHDLLENEKGHCVFLWCWVNSIHFCLGQFTLHRGLGDLANCENVCGNIKAHFMRLAAILWGWWPLLSNHKFHPLKQWEWLLWKCHLMMESTVVENTKTRRRTSLLPQSWLWAGVRHQTPFEGLEPPPWECLWWCCGRGTKEGRGKSRGNAPQFLTTHPLLGYFGLCILLLQYGRSIALTCLPSPCTRMLGLLPLPHAPRLAWGNYSFKTPQIKAFCGEFCLGNAACYFPLLESHSEQQQW